MSFPDISLRRGLCFEVDGKPRAFNIDLIAQTQSGTGKDSCPIGFCQWAGEISVDCPPNDRFPILNNVAERPVPSTFLIKVA